MYTVNNYYYNTLQNKLKKRKYNPKRIISLYYIITLYQQDKDGKLIDIDVNSQYLNNYRYYAL